MVPLKSCPSGRSAFNLNLAGSKSIGGLFSLPIYPHFSSSNGSFELWDRTGDTAKYKGKKKATSVLALKAMQDYNSYTKPKDRHSILGILIRTSYVIS